MPDREMSGVINDLFEQRMGDLSNQLVDGKITLLDWHIGMREELREVHKLQLVAAADGNKANVNPNDWLKLGSELKSQYSYLEDFAHAIKDGSISGSDIANRAKLYAGSGKITYWKQATKSTKLPTYPGQQKCLGRCGCEWVDNGDGSWTWKRGKTDSCHDCIHNEEAYNPYWPDGEGEDDLAEAA